MPFTKVAPAGIGTEPGTSIQIGDSLLHSTGIDLGSGTGIGASITRQGNATFTGIVTASSFSGDITGNVTGTATQLATNATGTNLTLSGNLGVGGVLTYEDVTNVDSLGIVTARAGINVVGNDLNVGSNIKLGNASGIVTATSFSGDGSSLTGIDASSIKNGSDVKIQANASGATVTGVITAVGGNSTEGSFLKGTAVGVGTTTATGALAGVGTAQGTLTFNTSQGLQCYMGDVVGWKTVTPFTTATGGAVSSAAGKTIHTFTSSGAFTVSQGTPTCEFLIVGGGGAGGQDVAGGGGGGGMVEGTISIGPGTYAVTVGDGGSNASGPGDTPAPGGNSVIAFPSNITAAGGGRGVGNPHFAGQPTAGGSSGGGYPSTQSATQPGLNPGVSGITQYGNPGGAWPSPGGNGGGGGGAGGAGVGANGGIGRASSISGTSVTYAGGGDGADQPNSKGGPGQNGHPGGGGYNNGSPGPQPHRNGAPGTGGGGAAGYGSWSSGGNGGPGIVIIRY